MRAVTLMPCLTKNLSTTEIAMTDSVTRANCFKLLAACFYEPDRHLFMEEQVCTNLKNLLASWAPGAAQAASDMERCLVHSEQDLLSVDHAALFIGPFELLAAPYGSVYLEKHRQVMGNSTVNVQKSYEEAGVAVDVREPPDHIAIELEFMHYLCRKEADAATAGDTETAAKFHNRQTDFYWSSLQWVPQLCESIRTGAASEFYQGLADCLEHFMITCEQYYEPQAH